MPTADRLGVAADVASEVRDERRHMAAIEQADVTLSAFVRLLLDVFRAFITDPRADAVVSAWRRSQLDGRAD